MHLCQKESLDESKFEILHQLILDPAVDINFKKNSNSPLLLLCQWNRSDSLYPLLKIFLKRNDLDLKATSPKGYNALMFLCRFYPHECLFDCVQLLIERGISLESKENVHGRNALQLLCQYYTGKNLLDIAFRLLYLSANYSDFSNCHRLLWDNKLFTESKIFHTVAKQLRSGRNPVRRCVLLISIVF